MEKHDEFLILKQNNTLFFSKIFKNNTKAENVLKNLSNLEDMSNNKMIVYINNLFIVSIFMIGCSIFLFFIRKYRNDWKKDLIPFYIVNFLI